jgi:hypothetical protein
MPDIKDSVGDGGLNRVHDVALVQVMLHLIKDARNVAYFAGNYDGVYANATKDAITQFQNDYKLISNPPREKLGQMVARGPTVQKLHAMLPAAYKDIRVLQNHKTVYLPGTLADTNISENKIRADQEFEPMFRAKVATLVREMYNTHKIVLWLTPTGRRRTFAQQAVERQTKAGPGESNHNFGRAVDIGFKGFSWIQGGHATKRDADWLNTLESVKRAEAAAFWDARDVLATKLGLFRLLFERVHLQAFNDSTVSSSRSLVKLLNAVGRMRWKTRYQCDLGSAGKHWVKVGTAKQIWAQNSAVTKADLAKVRTIMTGKLVKDVDIKAADITAMKAALKADFEVADKNWIKWQPVP